MRFSRWKVSPGSSVATRCCVATARTAAAAWRTRLPSTGQSGSTGDPDGIERPGLPDVDRDVVVELEPARTPS